MNGNEDTNKNLEIQLKPVSRKKIYHPKYMCWKMIFDSASKLEKQQKIKHC